MNSDVDTTSFDKMSSDEKILMLIKTVDKLSEDVERLSVANDSLATDLERIVGDMGELLTIIRNHEHYNDKVIVRKEV